MYLLSWIVLGAIAGWTTGRLTKGSPHGSWVDTLTGVAGALAGGLLILYGGLPGRFELISTTLSALLGAVVFTASTALVQRRKRQA